MPSPVYRSVVDTVSKYIGPEKAVDCVDRQLKHCNSTVDSFGKEQDLQVMGRVIGATSMWLGDAAKKTELKAQLELIAK